MTKVKILVGSDGNVVHGFNRLQAMENFMKMMKESDRLLIDEVMFLPENEEEVIEMDDDLLSKLID